MSCSRTQRSVAGEARVKHSTTEPLRSLHQWCDLVIVCVVIRLNIHFTSTKIKYLIYSYCLNQKTHETYMTTYEVYISLPISCADLEGGGGGGGGWGTGLRTTPPPLTVNIRFLRNIDTDSLEKQLDPSGKGPIASRGRPAWPSLKYVEY